MERQTGEIAGSIRRQHDGQFKRHLVELSQQPGASEAVIALEHGINANLLYMDSPATARNWSTDLAFGKRVQSYIRHLRWAPIGPCRHGICSHGANRYERLASSRKSYRQRCVMVRTWWP